MAGKQMQLEDWLDDLCVRFIINLPQEDLSSVARICFQVEEAQWFYEDFIRPLDASLPSMTLRTFCLRIFQHCPLLASFSVGDHTKAFEEFLEYKTRVPVRGAILLNHAMDSAVLVRGWKKGASWSFPRGKINKDEDDLDCAVREVWEETGLDLRAAGLVPTEAKPKYIEIPIKQQQLRLYIFRDVPMDTNFQPQTRKEISKIQWYKLSELPSFRKKGAQGNNNNNNGEAVAGAGNQASKFYMVAPFLVPLKKWVHAQKKIDEKKAATEQRTLHPHHHHQHRPIDEVPTDDDAWNQQELHAPYEVPAIETLDGATQELQRLLKMQPPTQGLQPPVLPPQNDKGSALLSILQSKNSGMVASSAQGAGGQMPHTPMDHLVTEAPHPRNPHQPHAGHQGFPVNTHQPPPPFALQQQQQGQENQWSYPQTYSQGGHHPQGGHHHQVQQGYNAGADPRFYGTHQPPLVHPQPLPPQVQRSMLAQKVMQENPKPAYPGDVAVAQGQQPHRQQPVAHTMPPGYSPQAGRPVALNGQSMALLNAFKRDDQGIPPAPPPHEILPGAGPVDIGGHGQQAPYGQHMPASGSAGVPFQQQQQQKSPTELAGSGVAPPTEHHRSALLDMFKKAPLQPGAAGGVSRRTPSQTDPANHPERQMLPQFSAPLYNAPVSGQQALASGHGHGHGHADAASVALAQLSLHARAGPANSPKHSAAQLTASPRMSNMAQSGTPPQQHRHHQHPQPMRILQRGQDPRAFTEQTPPIPNKAVPQPYAGHAPSGVPVEGGASDQKRQLLSLFGKQPGSPSVGAEAPEAALGDHGAAPELPRSRVASMASTSAASTRLGRQTPISPADQSFLLDYLQSVTNNATR